MHFDERLRLRDELSFGGNQDDPVLRDGVGETLQVAFLERQQVAAERLAEVRVPYRLFSLSSGSARADSSQETML
jgi:hypothetical protein